MAMPWLLAALLCAVARGKITEGTLAKGAGVSWHYLGRFVFDATDLAHASETQLAPIELSTQRLVEPYEQVRACSAARAERAWGAAQRRGCEVLARARVWCPVASPRPARALRAALCGACARGAGVCVFLTFFRLPALRDRCARSSSCTRAGLRILSSTSGPRS